MKLKEKYIEIAAQLWTKPKHAHKTMDPDLAMDIAELLQEIDGSLTQLGNNLSKKCECGGEKARTTHSLWCPKQK